MQTKDFFSVFGEAAGRRLPEIIVSGRHSFQASTIAAIVDDIVGKLRLRRDARLLEIGCGTGLLLRPLSLLVAEAAGIDHASFIPNFSFPGLPDNLTFIAGRFPDVRPPGQFHHILAYSVLHYLDGPEHARAFIAACLDLLAPGGRLLLGDLPNADSHRRFSNSSEGRKITEEYVSARSHDREISPEAYAAWAEIERNATTPPAYINDAFLLNEMNSLRERGYEAYLVPQPCALPFSQTREDLLVLRRNP